jgi:hypothetical protein
MAKRAAKSTSNKSASIREFMAANPEAGPTEIAKALNEREGWKISPAYVSTIKSKSSESPSGGRRKRRGRRRGAAAAVAQSGGSVNEQALIQAKKMAQQVGGIDQAKAALDLLGRLTS